MDKEDLHSNDVIDEVSQTEFQQRQQQMHMYDGYGKEAMEHNTIPPHMYGGPQFGNAQEEDEMWRNQQHPSYWQGGQVQQGYQGNIHPPSMPDGHYYRQFPNVNAADSYQPYLHRPNQDPEVAQAMLNLGNDRDGNHPMNHRQAPNDPAAHFFPPPPQYYYHPMDMQRMGHAQDPGSYYPTVHPREPQMYPPRDQGDRKMHVPSQHHPIAIDKKRKRPSDMPRRPLSAYNFFFSEERERILAEISEEDNEGGAKLKDNDSNEKKEDEVKDEVKDVDTSPSDPTMKPDKHDAESPPSEPLLKSDNDTSQVTPSGSVAAEESKSDAQDAAAAAAAKSELEKKPEPEQKSEITSSSETREQDVDPDSCGERLLTQRWEDSKKRRPHRKSHGKIAFKDLAKLIGQRWHKISEDRKKKYNKLAEKDLERYNEQMKIYNSKRTTKKAEGGTAMNFSNHAVHMPPNMMHHYGIQGHSQMMMHNQMVSDPKDQFMGRQSENVPTSSSNEQGTKR